MVENRRRERESHSRGEAKPSGLYYDDLKRGRKKVLSKEATPFFVSFTKSFGKAFSGFGRGSKFTEAQAKAFEFLGWDITPEQFYGTYKAIFLFGILLGVFCATGLIFLVSGLDPILIIVFSSLFIIAPIVLSFLYLRYPYSAVEQEKMYSLAYIPEIISYLVMSMRLVPNLEKAVEFAANNGRGRIAEDFKKLVWDVQIGRYSSIEEGLDEMAYRWGSYSDDFKHALMLIRSAVLENDDKRREELLEKAVNDVLEGSKEKMDLYARKLHQPTVYLYYFGILLPLLMAIILPIGSSMLKEINFSKAEYVFIIYNLFVPIGVFIFGRSIVSGRPPTYVPPDIPEDFPGVKKSGYLKWLAFIVFLASLSIGYYADSLQLASIPSYKNVEEEVSRLPHLTLFYEDSPFDEKIFIGYFTIFGIIIGLSLAISLYLIGKYRQRKKIQDEIRQMEVEFKDAMYVLASRLGENRPIEDALRHSIEFLPKSRVANQVFRRILDNITTLGMTLESAIFDPTFGALRNLPSQIITSGLTLMVNSVQLGVNVAAKSLINLAMQLRNAQKIDEMLRKLLEDVTVMLKSMSTFVAPIVLAVVASMQRLIITTLSTMKPVEQSPAVATAGFNVGGLTQMFSGEIAKTAADPATFTLILGIYVIEIVAILTYFNSQVEDTNNKLHTYLSIAYALPIAAILFCGTVFIASQMFVTAG